MCCNVLIFFRDASSARVFVLLFATVAWDLEELGILSCLWDIAPHLKEVLAQCQRNAFQLSMLQDSGNDMVHIAPHISAMLLLHI